VCGENLGALSHHQVASWRARHIGFVFQLYNLLPTLTAERNVELPLLLTPLSRAERKRHAETALRMVGLARPPGRAPAHRRRVARAVKHILKRQDGTGNDDDLAPNGQMIHHGCGRFPGESAERCGKTTIICIHAGLPGLRWIMGEAIERGKSGVNALKYKQALTLGLFTILSAAVSAQPRYQPPAGTRLHYLAFSGSNDLPPPFVAVDFVYGPGEGKRDFRWWQLEVRANTKPDAAPLLVLRALASADPLAEKQRHVEFARYQLRIPETGETYEYRDSDAGGALLPGWADFERHLLPHPASNTERKDGAAETCQYLGQLLSLARITIRADEPWSPWANIKRLDLHREMLVGNDRDFKDSEGHRLASSNTNDYTYVPLTEEDYRTAIEAGMNLFPVTAQHEAWVRSEPVFYLRDAIGDPALRYPADLYRANYLGYVMFVDEPASLILNRQDLRLAARYSSDLSTLFEMWTRASYLSADNYGVWRLEAALRRKGINLGDMRLTQSDFPTWDSYPESTYYEMKSGVAGIVMEGRFNVAAFDARVLTVTGLPWKHTPLQLLKFDYALMRGGTRPFGKFWGTAIYGQCDPVIAPLALTTAYDMGARYFWFWTSDHAHHLPWNEQISLARALKQYAAQNPRPSIALPQPKRDTVIAIPNGYFLSLQDFQWNKGGDPERREAGEKYQRVFQRALTAVHQCFDRGEDFDITINDGHGLEGYRRIIKIDDKNAR
jgi:hypothetical protein